ncbi:hypothetical protein [Kytococcus sp. Marseille-QA3725]
MSEFRHERGDRTGRGEVCGGCGAVTGGDGVQPVVAELDQGEQQAVAALVRSGLVGLDTALGLRAQVPAASPRGRRLATMG